MTGSAKQSISPRKEEWIASSQALLAMTVCRPHAEGPIRAWFAIASNAQWANPAEIKRQFGGTVDFVGDNRAIFDLGGNKYRLIVHISFAFGRVLVKFVGTHAEYDRIDPETVSWRKK
jgi:mRNA interferase HigB